MYISVINFVTLQDMDISTHSDDGDLRDSVKMIYCDKNSDRKMRATSNSVISEI